MRLLLLLVILSVFVSSCARPRSEVGDRPVSVISKRCQTLPGVPGNGLIQ